MDNNFMLEIITKEGDRVITVNSNDIEVNIYQKVNGEQKRSMEIRCWAEGADLHVNVGKTDEKNIWRYHNSNGGISNMSKR